MMNLKLSSNAQIYPWGKKQTRDKIVEACELIKGRLKAKGIAFTYRLNSGVPVVTDNTVASRGSYSRSKRRIRLHNGVNPANPKHKKAPFNTVEGLAKILIHEWMHAKGRDHRSRGIMKFPAPEWFDGTDVAWLSQYFDRVPTKQEELNALRRERDRLQRGY